MRGPFLSTVDEGQRHLPPPTDLRCSALSRAKRSSAAGNTLKPVGGQCHARPQGFDSSRDRMTRGIFSICMYYSNSHSLHIKTCLGILKMTGRRDL